VTRLDAPGFTRAVMVDATPVGKNTRSTVATYSGVFDAVRALFASTPEATAAGMTASDFSYNTAASWCPTCRGIGAVALDIQFLPDLTISCPDCHGSRYAPRVLSFPWNSRTIVDVLALTVHEAIDVFADQSAVRQGLDLLEEIGLDYLTLGEATPILSGGEAQRLKLVSEMSRDQHSTLFVFDEPTIGLHPLDVQTFLRVVQRLIDSGATVVVIEHDLDLISNADYVIDMGPGGGSVGGHVVASGTPEQVADAADSATGPWLKKALA
jgi:excinuclease ABC subunit A